MSGRTTAVRLELGLARASNNLLYACLGGRGVRLERAHLTPVTPVWLLSWKRAWNDWKNNETFVPWNRRAKGSRCVFPVR